MRVFETWGVTGPPNDPTTWIFPWGEGGLEGGGVVRYQISDIRYRIFFDETVWLRLAFGL